MEKFFETIVKYFVKGKRFLMRKARWLADLDWKELWLGRQSVRKFLRLAITDRMVLIVEPNVFHAEILPGFVEYFNQLGYETVLLCRRNNAESGVFCRVPENRRPIVLPMNPSAMRRCLKTESARRFEILFFTSTFLSVPNGFFGLFFDYLGFDPQPKSRVLMVEHHFPNLKQDLENKRFNPNQVFLLSRLTDQWWPVRMLNPHYFGAERPPQMNSDRVIFVTVGTVTKRNRSFEELIQAVKFLESNGHTQFVVRVVGRGATSDLFENASCRIEVLGYLDFPAMFEAVERAHFLLPLLNPDFEGHQRYLNGETTGSRQLILGFSKPPIIHEQFAIPYGFNQENAVIHGNFNLGGAMVQAIEMNPKAYQTKVEALGRLQREVRAESLENLKQAIAQPIK